MGKADESRREIETLRERISALSAAVLRINASLDVDTVLREIAEAARSLTGARYAVITAVDGDGQPEDYVISGLSPEETRQLEEWPDRLRVFEALRDLPSPLRLTDLPARRGPTSRPSSRSRRSASLCLMPGAAGRCRSTARRGGSWRAFSRRAARRRNCWTR